MIFKLIGPLWLTLIVILPLISFAGYLLIVHWRNKRLRSHWIRRFCLVLVLALMCLRPSLAGGAAPIGMTNLNVFFVVDTTGSMAAEDFDGKQTRLSAVSNDIKTIITNTAGAKYSVMTFNTETYLESPLTTDATSIRTISDSLLPQVTIYSTGSSISQPLDILSDQLQTAAKAYPDRRSVVYIFTDGEQTSKEAIKSFAGIKRYVSGGAVLGYGTPEGGKMKEVFGFYGDKKPDYVKDFTQGKYPAPDALSKIDESNLQTIATQIGVEYIHRVDAQSGGEIVKDSGVGTLADDQRTSDHTAYSDIYWLFGLIAAPLVGIELLLLLPAYRSTKQHWRV